jgi:ZIP family zinc transporter
MTALVLTTRRWIDAGGPLIGAVSVSAVLFAALAYLAVMAGASLAQAASALPAVGAALLATAATALATGAGAAPVLWLRTVPAQVQRTMLGFAAGIMLAASVFSLILPALDAGASLHGSETAAGILVALGIALGAACLLVLNRAFGHGYPARRGREARAGNASRVWLFIFAITLHNIPEGLAIGVSFGGGDLAGAISLALGIGIQNLPEGLAVALALLALGYSRAIAGLGALASGLVEPVGGVLGAGLVVVSQPLLPWGLAFAAGAMLFVIVHEIIPEAHRRGNDAVATLGIVAGFIVMMLFDTLFG